ncbi:hypothetical protein ACVIGB_002522 [Bradyrhizobium sp. USDA 4341]
MPARGKLKSAAVVAATNIPIETFNRWLDRKVIGLSGDDVPGDGRGKPRRFGLRTITKLAIAHKIARLGIPANIAVSLATKFTDEPQRGREIGCPFPAGRTVMTATLDGAATIHNVSPDGDVDSILKNEAALVVDIGSIIENLHFRLDTTTR